MCGEHVRREGVEAGAEDGARVEQHAEAPLDVVAHCQQVEGVEPVRLG